MKVIGKRVWIVIGDGVYPGRERTNSKIKIFDTKELAKAFVEEKKKKAIKKKKKKVINNESQKKSRMAS